MKITKKENQYIFGKGEALSMCHLNHRIFTIDKAELSTIKGKLDISLKNHGRINDEIELEDSLGKISIKKHEEDGLFALELSGQIKEFEPSFGVQGELCHDDTLRLHMSFKENYPGVVIYQHKEWWLRPAFFTDYENFPKRGQCIIRKREDDYEVILAVSGKDCRADFNGDESGIWVVLSSNCSGKRAIDDVAFIYGTDKDPYSLLYKMADYGLRLTDKEMKLRPDKRFPDIFKKWGWCTWDSLGQDVDEKSILEKMEDFERLGIKVPWVLIDDGWMDSDRNAKKLLSFKEDRERFPEGLKSTVEVLKNRYGVEHVGVWQAIKGYWNGLDEKFRDTQKVSRYVREYPDGEITVDTDDSHSFGFWDTWHSYLQKIGVDFVKIDEQSSFSLMTNGVCTYGEAARTIHKGIDASCDIHFDGNLINCMGTAPEDTWNRMDSALSRSSDDYTPTVDGSFHEHVLENAYNSILLGCFYWGDWDMVWSQHKEARESIILRAISGGPFYLSDGLGRTNPKELYPVITDDGAILRCDEVGRPTLDCLTEPGVMEEVPLKIYNTYEDVVYVSAFIDRQVRPVKGVFYTDSVPILDSACDYWVFNQQEMTCKLINREYSFEIPSTGAALFSLIRDDREVVVLGLVDKYISRAGVDKISYQSNICRVHCISDGKLGFVAKINNYTIRRKRSDGSELNVRAHKGKVEEIVCVEVQNDDWIDISWEN